ncbi:RNA polymerase sigma factor [Dyadobacter diqingensis]|uniref:RNA polymerase sigma factor n=1 Tax=Dyadobacter diqingensis TaxID=2938121 RepID=UPI0020C1B34C|nr:sigma-70 family RNA polymerase sigma factor [Dyadobacter diqingensis]
MAASLSEEELWHLFIAGDSAAFEALVDTTYALMYQYGSKFTRNTDLVKDCIQDVFLNVWEKRQSLNRAIPVRAYLLSSLRRRIHRKVKYDLIDLQTSLPESLFETVFSIEDSMIVREESVFLTRKITTLLNELPQRQKEVIYLRFFQDLDRSEIAEIMQITPQSVSNFLQKSFHFIRNSWVSKVSVSLTVFFDYLF